MSGSRVARLKRRIGYENGVPRCATCRYFDPEGLHLINSLPRFHHARCRLHTFRPAPMGCCDSWVCKATGRTLEEKV